jgi:hypothetical protein
METSAKTAMNVNEIFLAIGKFYVHQLSIFGHYIGRVGPGLVLESYG